ncbi:protein draper-like [Mytilus trossulus]|uniref:protein draper-like n=1 Tax=Mytilus trossulus TaxID=6551 RepID=UPI0030047210
MKCCPDFIEKDDLCEPCPEGTFGRSCEDHCPNGFYGKQCTVQCNCSPAQECHRIFGCVCPVGYTGNKCDQGDVTSVENTVTNIVATGYASEAIIIEVTTIKKSHSGPSNKEWLLYTICITGAIIITASSHLLRSYRKRKSRLKNEEVVVELTTTSPYTGFYHDIDDNIFNDVAPSLCLVSHPSKMEAVCFIPHENSFITRSNEFVNTDYLYPVFAPEDDEENSQQQQLHKKDNMPTCFSVSDVIVPLSIKSVNPSKVTETRHEHMHGYKVPVTVHQCLESSSGSDEDETDYKYSHVYQSLQKGSPTEKNDYKKLRTAESNIINDELLQATTQAI